MAVFPSRYGERLNVKNVNSPLRALHSDRSHCGISNVHSQHASLLMADSQKQNPLTLIMQIKSPADAVALKGMLTKFLSLPRNQNPIDIALDKLAKVHFARFVFLDDDTRLAIITSYDDAFDDYINDFVDVIGDIFNALLAHMSDAPPIPVQQNRAAFLAYVRANDLTSFGQFYSAYPTLGVKTILANARDAE